MWARLKATKDRWRQRAKSKNQRCRELEDQLSRERAKTRLLTTQMAELRLITTPVKVARCTYPAQMMALAVFVVIHGGSLRCAAATVGFYAELMGWKFEAPVHRTISDWVQRCGLHTLNSTENIVGDFRILIVVQQQREFCLSLREKEIG
ncbi:MAG: hypothetical protein HC821_00865 [Lewinella sp.]|nr:hypothetical protein [Lewinella sp.]